MVIDSRQKRFVMNMQLRQCLARAKPFRLKKIKMKNQVLTGIFDLKKNTPGASKKHEFQNLVSKMPNWQSCTRPATA